MRVGFVGPGLMGSRMIRNLAESGHEVTVYARSPASAEGLPATAADDIASAVDGTEIACLSVTDSDDVREVMEAITAASTPPPVVVDTSTIAPAVAREVAERASAAGVAYLDCPVSGGPPGAEAGTLAVMCGGEADDLATAEPVLDAIGDPAKRVHCGPVGAGLVAKLVNNLLVAVIAGGTAEAFGMGQRAGVEPEVLKRVVSASSGGSWQLDNLFPRVLAGDFEPGFRARDLRKDLGHALALDDVEMSVGEAAARLFDDLDGARDYGAVAQRFMDLPG